MLGVLVLTATVASADGERGPMFGAALVGTHAPDNHELGGVELEAALWRGRLGIAAHGSTRWGIDEPARATAAGGSLRLRVFECLMPSLLEPSDVELGIELHGIIEHTWWGSERPQQDSTDYGLGLAVRLRGAADEHYSATLLLETRLFFRVMTSRQERVETVARTMSVDSHAPREMLFLVGLGVSFGGGDSVYADRFRLHPPDPAERLLGGGRY